MGWITNKIGKWAVNTQHRELSDFVAKLRAMDGSEIGMIVAVATNQRHKFEAATRINLLQPSLALIMQPDVAIRLNSIIRDLQRKNMQAAAAGVMVWIHTVRATQWLELRGLGREMWRHLERGFDHCEDAELGLMALGMPPMNLAGYDSFPEGLTPDPL